MVEYDRPEMFGNVTTGIVIAGHFNEPDTYVTSRPRGMRDWLITYTVEGAGYFKVPGMEVVCKAGDMVMMRPEVPHEYGTVTGTHWNFLWAHFSPQLIVPQLLPDAAIDAMTLQTESIRTRVTKAFYRVIADLTSKNLYWHELGQNALREIVILLAQQRNQSIDTRIDETMRYMADHLDEPLNVQAIAAHINLSASRLSHLFKGSTGHSIMDTFIRMRIQHAVLLIEHTDRQLGEIAAEAGFHNYNNFIRLFKRHTGYSPRDYRALARR